MWKGSVQGTLFRDLSVVEYFHTVDYKVCKVQKKYMFYHTTGHESPEWSRVIALLFL